MILTVVIPDYKQGQQTNEIKLDENWKKTFTSRKFAANKLKWSTWEQNKRLASSPRQEHGNEMCGQYHKTWGNMTNYTVDTYDKCVGTYINICRLYPIPRPVRLCRRFITCCSLAVYVSINFFIQVTGVQGLGYIYIDSIRQSQTSSHSIMTYNDQCSLFCPQSNVTRLKTRQMSSWSLIKSD